MMKEINYESLFSVSREYFEKNFDSVLEKVDSGISPIRIRSEGEIDLLLFGWNDYMSQFGSLYTAEELAEIERACREGVSEDE